MKKRIKERRYKKKETIEREEKKREKRTHMGACEMAPIVLNETGERRSQVDF